LLSQFGYDIELVTYDSGRALISKGYLDKAEKLAVKNINFFSSILKRCDLIIGIEPSAILSIRDEYGKFNTARVLAEYPKVNSRTQLLEEFLLTEVESGNLNLADYGFARNIHVLQHVHCHQRALSDVQTVNKLLNSIPTWMCEQIRTGCCGMAGGFGYEAEHYELSQAVAGMGLFPAIKERPEHYVVASGMSCRHQIRDGVQRKARHPAELLMKLMENGDQTMS
jgi:Fe-S oxidoreductase